MKRITARRSSEMWTISADSDDDSDPERYMQLLYYKLFVILYYSSYGSQSAPSILHKKTTKKIRTIYTAGICIQIIITIIST